MRMKRIAVLSMLLSAIAVYAEGNLRVGAARLEIPEKLGPSQSGKYDHEHIYVRAIIIENDTTRAALISTEGGSGGAVAMEAVAKELNCPVSNVIISATHTHSGIAISSTAGVPVSGEHRAEEIGGLDKIIETVRLAKSSLQPARAGYGIGASYLSASRDGIDPGTRKWTQFPNLDAPSDKTVAVLTFEKPTGEPIAAYVNYAMHPINGLSLNIISGDFPGAMSRYVEKAFGDKAVIAFTQGASGDQNPLYLRPRVNALESRSGEPITGFAPTHGLEAAPLSDKGVVYKEADPAVIDNLFRFIESEGQVLGEEVIRVMSMTSHWSSDVRIKGEEKEVSCPGRSRINGSAWDNRTNQGVEGVYADGPPRVYQIGVLGIGTTAVAWINAEIYTMIGQKAKSEAPLANTIFSTISNNGPGGYTPDDASYGRETFEVLDSAVKPGCAETAIVTTVRDLEEQYLSLNHQ